MATHASIFDALPGIELPVSEISSTLSSIWETPDDAEYTSPSEFRATQMNLIVHFGQESTAAEAGEAFAAALRFSQRYPSRILLLCPEDRTREDILLTSKIFSECYIGKSGRDRSCCESIALAYPVEGKTFLENQVSILLENDLPSYYWIHRFHSIARVADYSFFLDIAKRVVFDSKLEASEVSDVPWPKPTMVRDLAFARVLPVRQSIGQFLSSFEPGEIVSGLTRLEVQTGEFFEAEGRCLCSWMSERLNACATAAGLSTEFASHCNPDDEKPATLSIRLTYANNRYFHWSAHPETGTADIDADLGSGPIHLPTSLKLMAPENALAEAFFF